MDSADLSSSLGKHPQTKKGLKASQPIPKAIPVKTFSLHGVDIIDDFAWLKVRLCKVLLKICNVTREVLVLISSDSCLGPRESQSYEVFRGGECSLCLIVILIIIGLRWFFHEVYNWASG
jgi:hypothetical protein